MICQVYRTFHGRHAARGNQEKAPHDRWWHSSTEALTRADTAQVFKWLGPVGTGWDCHVMFLHRPVEAVRQCQCFCSRLHW